MSDTLLLLSSPDTLGAKTHTPAGTSSYNAPVGPYTVTRVHLSSFADLADAVRACPYNAFVVRGETIEPNATTIPYRRTKQHTAPDGTIEPPTLRAQSHRYIPIDFDTPKFSTAAPMSDLYQSAIEARAILPPPLNTAQCLALATSNAGILPGTRVRLWYFADREVSDEELKAYLSSVAPVDTHIYAPYQPIYCAPPRFIGCEDPFPRRAVALPGEELILPPSLLPVPPLEHTPQAHQQALLAALATNPHRLTEGNRDNGLMSLAGSMRHRGFEAPAILAALREHNSTHVTPPLPDNDLQRIAASAATYAPAEASVLVTLPKDDVRARKSLNDQTKRVAEDPALLPGAIAALKSHVDSGALTEVQVATKLVGALRKADVLTPKETVLGLLRAAVAPADATVPPWQVDLIRSADGSIQCGPTNLHTILRAHPDFELWYDSRADSAQWQRSPWDLRPRPLEDHDGECLREWANSEMGWVSLPYEPHRALLKVAKEKQFEPWRDGYLEKLKWDGLVRLPHAARAFFGSESNTEACCFYWWMVSAVARSYTPGCQVDYMIVLEGEQGVGKSSFLQELVTHQRYYSRISTTGDLSNVRVTGKLQGPVVIEIAELSSLNKRDVEQTKEFLDNREDKWQPLYSHSSKTSPRKVVFAGTTNKDTYLQDVTGARRFWPIRVSHKINIALVREFRDQLWAEAVAAYKSGTRWHPTDSEALMLGLHEVQEERREAEAGEDVLLEILNKPHVAGVTGINCPPLEAWMLDEKGMIVCLSNTWLGTFLRIDTRHQPMQVSKTMTALRWVRGQPRDRGGRSQRLWYKPGHEPKEKR